MSNYYKKDYIEKIIEYSTEKNSKYQTCFLKTTLFDRSNS